MCAIEYLIKLIKEEQYIDTLICDGEMFMRSAEHFADLERETNERGTGDIRENIIFDFIRVGYNHPIYCLYSVFSNDVVDNSILINKKFIDTFSKDKKGFIALIEFNPFMKKLVSYTNGNMGMYANKIHYGKPTPEFEKEIFIKDSYKISFFKDLDLEYQQEYRIMMLNDLKEIEDNEKKEKFKNTEFKYCRFKKYEDYIACIGDISEFSRKINISLLKEYNQNYYSFPLTNN